MYGKSYCKTHFETIIITFFKNEVGGSLSNQYHLFGCMPMDMNVICQFKVLYFEALVILNSKNKF